MPKRHLHFVTQAGFTLVELVVVIAVLGIMSTVAIMNSGSPAELSLPSQAEKMANDVRYIQTLAHTSGKRMRFSITTGANGSYSSASCDSVSGPCTSPVTVGKLEKGIVLGGTATVDFDTLGQPSAAASYTLTIDGSKKTVSVAPLTGFVTVTTP